MKKSVKDEWVKRLRSGDYEQGEGYLRLGDKYCCLGVLCDMAVEAGVIEETDSAQEKVYAYGRSEDDSDFETMTLPVSVAKWAGLMGTPAVKIQSDGRLRVFAYDLPKEEGWVTSAPVDLVVLNDDDMCSFEQIADVIEAGIKGEEEK